MIGLPMYVKHPARYAYVYVRVLSIPMANCKRLLKRRTLCFEYRPKRGNVVLNVVQVYL